MGKKSRRKSLPQLFLDFSDKTLHTAAQLNDLTATKREGIISQPKIEENKEAIDNTSRSQAINLSRILQVCRPW